jgi:hypothetical protein
MTDHDTTPGAPETEALAERIITFVGQCVGQADPQAGVVEMLATRDAAQRAAGWDEGHTAGALDVTNMQLFNIKPTENPYRSGAQC